MIWFERIWPVGDEPHVKLWIVRPPTDEFGESDEPRPPDVVVPKSTMDSIVVEYLRGPPGPPGPVGMEGPKGEPAES